MRLVKFALPALFLAALALFAARAWTDAADAAARSLAVEHSRGQFAQRAGVVRGAADLDRYRAEQKQLLRAWFAEAADLGNRWPALRGLPGPFVPPPPRVKGGDLKEYQELAESTVGAWREGRFDVLQTVAAGGLRLDLLKVSKTGPQSLAVDLAVWGAPQEIDVEETREGRQQQKASVPLSFRGLSLRFFDADAKLIAEMPGEGEPSLRLDLPERLVPDAPPGLVLARYEPGVFPREAAEIEWTLTAFVRTSTGELRPLVAVFKTKAEAAWALGAGEAWGGKERTLTKDEEKAQKPPVKAQAQR